MAKKSSRVATAFLLILAGSLLLTACTTAPAKDLENLDAIYLEPGTVTESASPSEPAVQEYAKDPDSEIEIDDQVGDGITLKIHEIQVSRGNAFLVIYNSQNFVVSEAFVTPQSQPVTLFFDIPILQSQELQAALYLDDGDGVFDLGKDLPILGEDNELVHETFSYQVSK